MATSTTPTVILLPFREVVFILKGYISQAPNYEAVFRFDYENYLMFFTRYIFDERKGGDRNLETTCCRPALMRLGFNEVQVLEIENAILERALEILGPYWEIIHGRDTIFNGRKITGYFYEFSINWDLHIILNYE